MSSNNEFASDQWARFGSELVHDECARTIASPFLPSFNIMGAYKKSKNVFGKHALLLLYCLVFASMARTSCAHSSVG